MGKPVVVHSVEYEIEGTSFTIEVFRSKFGRTSGPYGFRAVWTRHADGYKGEGALAGTIEGAVANAQIQAAQNRTL